jgi:polyisoprenoid-binding protein YceI
MRHALFIILIFAGLLSACATLMQPPAVPTTAAALSPAITQAAPSATPNSSQASPTAGTNASPAATPPASSGTIDYKIVPGQSYAGYEVGETFFNQNNRFNLAIGKTTQISGDIYGNKTDPSKSTIGTITVDISQLKSDSNQRDNFIRRRFLESTKFPLATFVPTKITNLHDSYVEGKDYTFTVTGNLTVHQVTKPVTFTVTAKLTGDTLSGTANAAVKLSDFGVGPISLMGMLQTQNDAKLDFSFVAQPAA